MSKTKQVKSKPGRKIGQVGPTPQRVVFPTRLAKHTLTIIVSDAKEGENPGRTVDRWARDVEKRQKRAEERKLGKVS